MSLEFIEKRDGSIMAFDKSKIVNAIIPAMREANNIDYAYAVQIATDISNLDLNKEYQNNKNVIFTVEKIQDLVENKLMEKYPDTARKYILYRNERTKIRNMKTDLMKHIKEKVYASNVLNANANIDERNFNARKNETAGLILKELAINEMLDPDVKKAWDNNLLYLHDFSEYMIGEHNCLNLDMNKLLTRGFRTRNADIRPANSLASAMSLTAICLSMQSLNMFGGAGIAHIDRDLAPFVRISFLKHFKNGLEFIQKDKKKTYENFIKKYGEAVIHTASMIAPVNIFKSYNSSAYKYAMAMLDKEAKQSCEAFYHNSNTLEARSSDQLPFVSINFGLDTTFEGRFITKYLLEASLDGIGKYHSTPIFPISIFQYKTDINDRPGTPNYDLFKLSIKSTAKRIYPNYVNCQWSSNEPAIHPSYLISNPNNYPISGDKYIEIVKHDKSVIRTKIKIKDLFNELAEKYGKEYNAEKKYYYIDIRFIKDPIYISDNESKYKDHFIELDENSSKLNYIAISENGKDFSLTTDTYGYNIYNTENNEELHQYFKDDMLKDYVYDFNTEMSTMGSCDGEEIIKYRLNEEIITETFKEAWDRLVNIYGPAIRNEKAYYVNTPKNLWIADSSCESGFTRVKRIIRNDDIGVWNQVKLKSGKTILLTNDHPLPTQRGRIFVKDLDLGDRVSLAESDEKMMIIGLKKLGFRNEFGYDVETESDHFDVSGINSHNCRTLIGKDINGLGYSKIGRGNVVPATMILPKIAIKYGICLGEREKPDIDGFLKELDELMKITEKSLVDRYKYIASQKPSSAFFMYENETIQGADETKYFNNVSPAMRHGTLAMGFLGLSNALYALFGKYQNQDKKVKEFGNSIVKRIFEYTKQATERNHLNFSCYATPAESLSHTALKKLREEFGIIKGVTDKEYLNNSYHVPVYEKISIKDKIDIESEYTYMCTGGNITYVELDANVMQNLDSIEDIIRYAMDNNEHHIAYFALNFPIDNCLDCGYSGVIEDSCPKCHAPTTHIQRLRRCTGYLTADYKTRFNYGKQHEVDDRIKHSRYTNMNKKF